MKVPKVVQQSCFFQICMLLYAQYGDSRLHALLVKAGAWCNKALDESLFVSFFCRDGVIARAWPESILCRVITFLADLPARFLHWLYLRFQPLFDTSFFANLAFTAGHETAVMESWMILGLWIIPYANWINGYSLIAFFFLFMLFHAGAMSRSDFRLDVKGLGLYPVLMAAGVVLGVLLSYAPSLSLRFLMYYGAAALCVIVTISAIRHLDDLKRILAGCTAVIFIISVYGIIQRIQGVEVNKSYVDMSLNADMPGRVQSIFDNPNTYAEVLVMLLPLVIALLFISKKPISKAICLVSLLLGVVNLGMTYSRAGWIGIAVSVAVLVFLWKPKLIPAFIAVGILAIPLLPTTIFHRILTIGNLNDTSTSSRFPLWKSAIRGILMRPFTGTGLGIDATQSFFNDYHLYQDRLGRFSFVHAHNTFLEVWLETGITGLIGFVGSSLWSIKRAGNAVRHCSNEALRIAASCGAAAITGALVCGMADYLWHYPRVLVIFWFTFAMTVAATKLCMKEQAAA